MFDPSARDPARIARMMPHLRRFVARYFRLQVSGLEHIGRSPCLYVGNHNGGIFGPDLICTLTTLWHSLGAEFPLYALAHDFVMQQIPWIGRSIAPFGAVRASRDHAREALRSGGQVLVYPGGDLDAYRHWKRRNEVVLGPRDGFVKLARDEGVPIVPAVAYGAHRSAVIFHEGERIARMLRMRRWARLQRFPLALSLPWGLALGPYLPYFPLPIPVRLRFLPPVHVPASASASDVLAATQATMQRALDQMRASRHAARAWQ